MYAIVPRPWGDGGYAFRLEGAPVGTWSKADGSQVHVAVCGRVLSTSAAFQSKDSLELAYLIAETGPSVLDVLEGSFTFILLDEGRRRISIGVDKLGQSQAYVYSCGSFVAVATSLYELLENIAVRPSLDYSSIFELLCLGWVPAPNSMFEGVQKLRGGTFSTWDGFKWSHSSYYRPGGAHSEGPAVEGIALGEQIRSHLRESVRLGATAADEWGAFSSGGLDSSSVVWALSQVARRPVFTYYGSFGALDRYLPLPDEAYVAKAVAERFGTHHTAVTIAPEVVQTVPELVRTTGEPLVDGGPLVVNEVLKRASSDVRWIMTGVGGDFLFGGERRHLLLSLLQRTRRLPGWRAVCRLAELPLGGPSWLTRVRFDLQRAFALHDLSLDEFYARRLTPLGLVEAICKPRLLQGVKRSPLEPIRQSLDEASGMDDLTQLLYLDLRMLTPDSLVRDVTTLSRHASVEACNPYLNGVFVDFAMAIPSKEKVRGLTLKYGMRKAMRGHLPDEVLKKRKGGLGAPVRWWVTRDEFVAQHLSREVVEERGLFDYERIRRMRQDTLQEKRDFSTVLWSLFSLEVWMREFGIKA